MADIIGYGVTLLLNDGGAGAFAELLYLRPGSLTPWDPQNTFADDTYLNQGSRVLTAKPSMIQPGNWSYQAKFDVTEYGRARTAWALTVSGTCPQWRLDLGTPTHTVSSWCQGAKIDPIQLQEIVTFTVSLLLNSDVTIA